MLGTLLEQEENDRMDFKVSLPLDKPSQRKELAKDICCFANSQGGHLVIGVDKDRTRVGIPPGSLNVDVILKVARERIRPAVNTAQAWEEVCEEITYGIIAIDKTHHVHQTIEGVHFIRVKDNCIRADTSAIVGLGNESREHWIAETRRLQEAERRDFIEIESTQADAILNRLLEQCYGDGLVERLSSSRRERKWHLRSMVDCRLNAFKDACSITLDPESPEIDEIRNDLLRTRAIGMLAMAHLGSKSDDKNRKVRLILEYDPEVDAQRESEYKQEAVLEWAMKFRNYQETEEIPTHDRGLLEESLRLLDRLTLENEMRSTQIQLLRDNPKLMLLSWVLLSSLAVDSTWDLSSGNSRWVQIIEREHRNACKQTHTSE